MNNWPIRKIYLYVVCTGAIFMIVVGAVVLLSTLANMYILKTEYQDSSALTFAISMLIVGLPIWYWHWKMVQKESIQ